MGENLGKPTRELQNFIQKNHNPGNVDQREIFSIYQKLIDCIIDHNHLYYMDESPIISDYEYDQLFAYLKKIEEYYPFLISGNSPTQGLVGQIQEGFKKAKHKMLVLSLENSYNAEDLREREDRIKRILEKSRSDKYGLTRNSENNINGKNKLSFQDKDGNNIVNPDLVSGDKSPRTSDDHINKGVTFYILEPKFDGVSVELIYKQGIFTQAITRGDGIQGEDVTENVKTIKGIPKKIDKIKDINEISFRGEIVISKSKLKHINQERKLNGDNMYANTRNLASGSLKQLDTKITADRDLQCFVYESTLEYSTNDLYSLAEYGFAKRDSLILKDRTYTIDDIISIAQGDDIQEELRNSDIEFDGLVVKVGEITPIQDPPSKRGQKHPLVLGPIPRTGEVSQQSLDGGVKNTGVLSLRQLIGSTAHHPRRAIAYKFPAEQVGTQIKSVDFQVGRTGIITPVANLEPVNLSGATISRVSLHNFDFIKDKDIHYNDYIRLQRSGEVIPYVVSVIKERRGEVLDNVTCRTSVEKKTECYNENPIDFPQSHLSGGSGSRSSLNNNIQAPTKCPSCKEILTQVDIHHYCTNLECPAQIKEKVIHFVSKNCMNIEGVGDSIVDILVEQGIIRNIFDIYKLLEGPVEFVVRRLPGFADKKVYEIKKQLESSKKIALWRFLNALGIPGVGKKIAQDLAVNLYSTINNLAIQGGDKNNRIIAELNITLLSVLFMLNDREFLLGIYGIGEKIVDGIQGFLEVNQNILEQANSLGFSFENDILVKAEVRGTFSLTGTFGIPRDKIVITMQKHGYTFHENPKKDTDIFLIGNRAGSKKKKAEKLGIKVLEGWNALKDEFTFLSSLYQMSKGKRKQAGPEQKSLFG